MKKEINLLPEKYRDLRKRNRLHRIKIIGIISMALFIIVLAYAPFFIVNKLSNEDIIVKNQVKSMKDMSEFRIVNRELEKDLNRRQKIIHALKANSNAWSKLITKIGQKVPEGMELISIEITENGSLKISGRAQNCNLVAQFMVGLLNIDIISEVEPISITAYGNGLYGFELDCVILNGSDNNEAK